ncbi:MAG: HAD family hydrolase [Longimicrobiales bacterium]
MDRARTPIRAVLFDADGVIQHATADLETRLHTALGFVPDSIDDFLHDVYEAEWPALAGQQDFVEALAPVLVKWGVEGSAGKLAACWSSIEADTLILTLIGTLRGAGYFCALATNQQRYRGAHMAHVLGYDVLFDRSFYSYEIGFRKPDAGFFHAVLASLPFQPQEMLFIDDLEANVVAAATFGLAAVQFVHDGSSKALPALTSLLQQFSVRAST